MRIRNPRILLALVGLGTAACGGGSHPPAEVDTRPPVGVTTARVAVVERPDVNEAGGVVRARTSATLVARIMAPVRQVRVQPGDRVRAGQALVLLDGRDLSANAQSARTAGSAAENAALAAAAQRDAAAAALTLAKATFDRVSSLHAKKSATPNELDQATANLRAAEAQVAAATANAAAAANSIDSARSAGDAAGVVASYAVITAPFDGIVTEKLVEPGTMASPGMPLVRIDDMKGFRLEVRLDESRAAFIKTGDKVPVSIEGYAGVAALQGTVSEVARAIDSDARAFLVKVDLPDPEGVRSGMYGRVSIPGRPRQAVTVPEAAVVRRGQVASVFVVEQDRARIRLVSTGATRGGATEILAGAGQGDVVVVAPPEGGRE
jgi:RND family efflux transporter MFP subunit